MTIVWRDHTIRRVCRNLAGYTVGGEARGDGAAIGLVRDKHCGCGMTMTTMTITVGDGCDRGKDEAMAAIDCWCFSVDD